MATAVGTVAQAARLSDEQRQELLQLAAAFKLPGNGLLQRMTRLPGKLLVRGAEQRSGPSTPARGGVQNGSGPPTESIAKQWAHFLLEEAEAEPAAGPPSAADAAAKPAQLPSADLAVAH